MFSSGNEDIFSPLQIEATSNENVCRDSRSMPEFLYSNAHIMEKNIDIRTQKRYNLVENINSRSKVNGTKEEMLFNVPKICEENKHVALPKNYVPVKNFEEIEFGNSFDKDLPMEICIPDCRISFPNKRSRSSSLSGKDYQELNNFKTLNTTFKCKQVKPCFTEDTQNFLPLRSEKRKNKDQMADKIIMKSCEFPTNNLLKCTEKKEIEVIDLETMESCDSNLEESKTYSVQTTNEMPTRFMGHEFNYIKDGGYKKTVNECNYKENSVCISTIPNYSLQPHQVQANIIEQLIKETVSFEFDAIRQLLYLQQMLLLRHLQQNLEVFESHNSLNGEFILKIIEELMQENKLLKKAVVANQRRT